MSSINSRGPEQVSGEEGYLMLFLCPLLLLALLFLAGSVQVIRKTQKRVALQSRLDICAVDLAVNRQKLFASLTKSNRWVSATATGVAMARGAILLGGPIAILVSTVGVRALLIANRAAAIAQDIEVKLMIAKEILNLRCAPTPFSDELATCWASPSLQSSLFRTPTLFRDTRGALQMKQKGKDLSLIRCMGSMSRTEISINGDSTLTTAGWTEKYAQ